MLQLLPNVDDKDIDRIEEIINKGKTHIYIDRWWRIESWRNNGRVVWRIWKKVLERAILNTDVIVEDKMEKRF